MFTIKWKDSQAVTTIIMSYFPLVTLFSSASPLLLSLSLSDISGSVLEFIIISQLSLDFVGQVFFFFPLLRKVVGDFNHCPSASPEEYCAGIFFMHLCLRSLRFTVIFLLFQNHNEH